MTEPVVRLTMLAMCAGALMLLPHHTHAEEQLALPIAESREYPFNAIKLGLQGTTTVKINLLPDGQAESVRVRKSSGHHLLDAGLADLKVSGRFNCRDIESFLNALEEALPVKVTRVNPQLVIVERAKAEGL